MSLGPSQLISFNHIQFPSFIFEKKDSNPSLLFVEEAKPITSSFHYLTQPKERKDQPSRREQQELKEEKSINGAAFSWMNALSSIWLISFLPRPSIQSTNEKSFLCWWMKGGKAASFLQLNGNEIEGSWVALGRAADRCFTHQFSIDGCALLVMGSLSQQPNNSLPLLLN